MIPPLHITLGRLINRAYLPAFLTAPEATDLSDLGFALGGIIYGTDPGGIVTPYGFIAKSLGGIPGQPAGSFVAAIRGTNSPGEWFEDFKAFLVPSDFCSGSETEQGFTEIYKTLRVGRDGPALGAALAGISGLTTTGHSLGGPLATMLAADLKADALVGFASPKPGNGKFAAWVRASVANIDLYANAPDVVPHTPLTLAPFEDYLHVDSLTTLDSSKIVSGGLSVAHSLDTYLHLLDPSQPLPAQ